MIGRSRVVRRLEHATCFAQRGFGPSLAAIAAFCLVGCTSQVGQPDGEAPEGSNSDVGTVSLPLENGAPLAGDDTNSVTRLWVFNSKFNEYRQICTGVLLRNNISLTAAHCLRTTQEEIDNGFPNLNTNISALIVTTDQANFGAFGAATAFAPDGRDIAAIGLSANLPVKTGGQVRTTGFFHPLAGTLPDGQWIAELGYGPPGDETSTICNYVSLRTKTRIKGCLADPLFLNYGVSPILNYGTRILSLNLTSTAGDSGGPVLSLNSNANSIGDLPLLAINANAYYCIENTNTCGADGTRLDDLSTWLHAL